MLGKLIKYEFIATARLLIPVYIAAIIFAVLTRLFTTPNFNIIYPNGSYQDNFFPELLYGLFIFFNVVFIIAIMVISFVIILQRFYTSLFKDEGYLTHTLPVSTDTLIWGKLIPAACWAIASFMVMSISIMITTSFLWWDTINFTYAMQTIFTAIQIAVQEESFFIILLLPLYSIVGLLVGILGFYSAMSIGQLVNQYKILAAVGAYFFMSFLFSIFTGIIQSIAFYTIDSEFYFGQYGLTLFGASITLGILLFQGIIHYFIIRYILKNKLNLE